MFRDFEDDDCSIKKRKRSEIVQPNIQYDKLENNEIGSIFKKHGVLKKFDANDHYIHIWKFAAALDGLARENYVDVLDMLRKTNLKYFQMYSFAHNLLLLVNGSQRRTSRKHCLTLIKAYSVKTRGNLELLPSEKHVIAFCEGAKVIMNHCPVNDSFVSYGVNYQLSCLYEFHSLKCTGLAYALLGLDKSFSKYEYNNIGDLLRELLKISSQVSVDDFKSVGKMLYNLCNHKALDSSIYDRVILLFYRGQTKQTIDLAEIINIFHERAKLLLNKRLVHIVLDKIKQIKSYKNGARICIEKDFFSNKDVLKFFKEANYERILVFFLILEKLFSINNECYGHRSVPNTDMLRRFIDKQNDFEMICSILVFFIEKCAINKYRIDIDDLLNVKGDVGFMENAIDMYRIGEKLTPDSLSFLLKNQNLAKKLSRAYEIMSDYFGPRNCGTELSVPLIRYMAVSDVLAQGFVLIHSKNLLCDKNIDKLLKFPGCISALLKKSSDLTQEKFDKIVKMEEIKQRLPKKWFGLFLQPDKDAGEFISPEVLISTYGFTK